MLAERRFAPPARPRASRSRGRCAPRPPSSRGWRSGTGPARRWTSRSCRRPGRRPGSRAEPGADRRRGDSTARAPPLPVLGEESTSLRGGSNGARKARFSTVDRGPGRGVGEPDRPQADCVYALADARPLGVQGLRRTRRGARRTRRRRRPPARPRLRRRVRAEGYGDRPRHATVLARPGRRLRAGRRRPGRRRRRARADRHRDALLRGRRVRLRGRHPGHRLAQPPPVQRHEDRPPRRDAGRRRHRPRQDQGACARERAALPRSRTGERSTRDVYDGFGERVLRFIDPAAWRRCGSCWTAPTAWPGR